MTEPTVALPAAVLWDMDGTLVDTEPYWMAAEREVATAFAAGISGGGGDRSEASTDSRDASLVTEGLGEFLNLLVSNAAAALEREGVFLTKVRVHGLHLRAQPVGGQAGLGQYAGHRQT